MKICMVFPMYQPNYQRDGIGDYTRILVENLRALGHEVYVVASAGYKGNDKNVFKIFREKWGINEVKQICRLAREYKFDIVHIQYTPVSYGFGVAFKLLPLFIRLTCKGTKCVTTFHTLVGGKWISKVNAALLVIFSHRIITTHEELTCLYRKYFGVFKKKCREIPIGSNIIPGNIDTASVRADIEQNFGIDKNAVLLVNFGFPNPWKGLENLCNALKILVKKNNYYLLLLYSM
ncbi:MAG: glycosyltransferase, partial [Candidatus Omnitrophica bacterium]|nr:glycosyltransferase [Candidatus Omnitrophota bacterium]